MSWLSKAVKKLTPSEDKNKSTAVPAMFLGGDFATPYINREIGDWYKGYNEKKKEPAREAAAAAEKSFQQQQEYYDWQKEQADKLLADKDSAEAKAAAAAELELMKKRVGQSSLIATQDPETGKLMNTAIPFVKKKAGQAYYG